MRLLLLIAAATVALASGPASNDVLAVSRRRSSRWSQTTFDCLHADDCGSSVSNGNTTCVSGTCVVACKEGYELSSGACRRKTTLDKRWGHSGGCPPGTLNFYGSCLSSPSTPATHKPCSSDCDCSPLHQNAYGFCNAGTCTFVCRSTFRWNGRVCGYSGTTCSNNHQCADGSPASLLQGVCAGNKHCTATCPQGYVNSGGCCTKKPASCGHKDCLPISDGYSDCKNGQCKYYCNVSTAKPSCNKQRCKCIDNQTNPNHCGQHNKFCPPPKGAYPGKCQPKRACIDGQCGFVCPNGKPLSKRWGNRGGGGGDKCQC